MALFYLFLITSILLALYTYKGVKQYNHKKHMNELPTSKIRSIAMGLVELHGKARGYKELLKSPMSMKDCIYYRYKVEKLVSTGRHTYWVTLKEGHSGRYFFLEDETGNVLVDLDGADIDINKDTRKSSGMFKDPPEKIKSFLKKEGLSYEGLFGINKTMRYTEWFIAPEDELYIVGTAGDNPFVREASSDLNENDIMIQKAGSEFYVTEDKMSLLPAQSFVRDLFYIFVFLILLFFWVISLASIM